MYVYPQAERSKLKGNVRRGVSKAEWLEAGLDALGKGSVAGITVEGLARSLGIARAGFYWHFKDRQELLSQLLDYWIHETTEVATKNPQILAIEPRRRLIKAAEMIVDYDLARFEMAIRQWGLQDKEAAKAVRKMNRIRLDFVGGALSELGFSGDDLDMRSMLFVCYQTWETLMFPEVSRKRRRELIMKRVDLIVGR